MEPTAEEYAAARAARSLAPSAWGTCECGHPAYDHSRSRHVGDQSMRYSACRFKDCECEEFRASDGSDWPEGPAGGKR